MIKDDKDVLVNIKGIQTVFEAPGAGRADRAFDGRNLS